MRNREESRPMLMSRARSSMARANRVEPVVNRLFVDEIHVSQAELGAVFKISHGKRQCMCKSQAERLESCICDWTKRYDTEVRAGAYTSAMDAKLKTRMSMLGELNSQGIDGGLRTSHTLESSQTQSQVPPTTLEPNWNDYPLGYRYGPLTVANRDSRLKKVEMPSFDGSYAHAWLGEIEHFFAFGRFREEDKLDVVAFAMTEKAKKWFAWVMRRKGFIDWSDFKHKLLERFDHPTICPPVKMKLEDEAGSVREVVYETEMMPLEHSPSMAEPETTIVEKNTEILQSWNSPYCGEKDDLFFEYESVQSMNLEHDSVQKINSLFPSQNIVEMLQQSSSPNTTLVQGNALSWRMAVNQMANVKKETPDSLSTENDMSLSWSKTVTPVNVVEVSVHSLEVSHLTTMSAVHSQNTETSGCVENHEAIQMCNHEPMQEMQKIESPSLHIISERSDAENVTLIPKWTVISKSYCLHRPDMDTSRRVTCTHKQRKSLKAWKFKYKTRILQHLRTHRGQLQIREELLKCGGHQLFAHMTSRVNGKKHRRKSHNTGKFKVTNRHLQQFTTQRDSHRLIVVPHPIFADWELHTKHRWKSKPLQAVLQSVLCLKIAKPVNSSTLGVYSDWSQHIDSVKVWQHELLTPTSNKHKWRFKHALVCLMEMLMHHYFAIWHCWKNKFTHERLLQLQFIQLNGEMMSLWLQLNSEGRALNLLSLHVLLPPELVLKDGIELHSTVNDGDDVEFVFNRMAGKRSELQSNRSYQRCYPLILHSSSLWSSLFSRRGVYKRTLEGCLIVDVLIGLFSSAIESDVIERNVKKQEKKTEGRIHWVVHVMNHQRGSLLMHIERCFLQVLVQQKRRWKKWYKWMMFKYRQKDNKLWVWTKVQQLIVKVDRWMDGDYRDGWLSHRWSAHMGNKLVDHLQKRKLPKLWRFKDNQQP